MSHDRISRSGADAPGEAGAKPSELADLCGSEGSGDGGSIAASLGLPTRSRFSLSENAKRRIEIDARKCAREGVTRRDGCRWAFGTAEGQHWTAVFLLEGGVL